MISLKDIFKKNFIIGLDIGTSCVKVVQFESRSGGLCLIKADLKEIKSVDNKVNREQEIVEILDGLMAKVDKIKSQIIVTVNCPDTDLRKITIPCMPTDEIADCISLSAKNYFPYAVNNAWLDYEILGETLEKGVKKIDVLVAISPKVTVDRYLSLLAKAGYAATSLIPVSLALQRVAQAAYTKEDKVRCFMDIGGLHTELIILKGKNLIFSRKIPIAGKDFTRALTGVLASDRGKIELSLEEAEKIKQEIGIPSEVDSKIINDKISTAQILSMLRDPLTQLVNEIGRCFDYCREESGSGPIESLVLFGAGSSLGGLTRFLSSELGLKVSLGDPLQGFEVASDALCQKGKLIQGLAAAVGAALSRTKGINLLPSELKDRTQRLFKRTAFEVIASVAILVLVFIYIGMKIKLNNYQKRITVAKLELSSMELQLKQAQVVSLLADEPYWKDVLKELSNLVPSDIYITKLSMNNRIITIKGIVPAQQGQERISSFMIALQKGLFDNVKLVSAKDVRGKTAKVFVINCWVDKK